MKFAHFIRPLLGALILVSFFSCKDKKEPMANVSGSSNEVLVVMDKQEWNGPIGDTVKNWFKQEQLGLPQPEPVFDVLNLPTAFFEKNVKAYRNILYVKISKDVGEATIRFQESPWARTQKYFEIAAPDNAAFLQIFNANKQKMMDVFLKAEQDRLVAVNKKKPEAKIASFFKDKYHLLCYFPSGYIINKDLNDFAWISRETRVDSRGVIFMQKKYENINQFEFNNIVKEINTVLKENIPGPLPASYMALDTVTPIVSKVYNYDETHYAVEMRGLWMVVNDFMGGPFVLNVVLDEKNQRVIYMMGYVYAPEDHKRNIMRQVEAVVFSMGFEE